MKKDVYFMAAEYKFYWFHKGEIGYEQGLQKAIALRTEVFVKEQGFVVEEDETDKTAYHLLVEENGKIVAVARIFTEDGGAGWYIGRVAVKQTERGRGLGLLAVREAEQKACALGGKSVALSAQQRVQPFYEKCGYHAMGDVYYDEGVPHIRMEKNIA